MESDESANPGNIRASDADRSEVVERLGHAVSEGRLDLSTYSARAAMAYAAETRDELIPLTSDLPPPAPAQPVTTAHAEVDELSALLGNETRKGHWLVPQRVVARAVLGNCHIEMQHATLRHQVTTIEATAILGAVTIFVPAGIDVRLFGSAILGGKSSKVTARPAENAPILNVICHVRCGSVTVRPPKRWGMG